MSIFKSTFKNFVKNQIYARQNLVSVNGNRPVDLQKYSAATPWVKMTSFVDYADLNKNPNAEPNKDLAKRYVLMGGTLYPDMNDITDRSFDLRSGILREGGAYGTDLGSSKANKVDLQYGIRPMPGITSVNVKSKSAYGSLREATVKFFASDVKQLEDLLILYMRPGYPVLLEWGWSMYIDTGGIVDKDGNDKEDKNDPKVVNPKVKSFDDYTINCFKENLTQQEIYDAIEVNQQKFGGNYEAMLGLIRNYETSMLPNGGFECTTTLISIGDVIDSLKMNSENGEDNKTGDADKKEYKDEFELLLSGYIYENALQISTNIKSKILTIKSNAFGIPGIDTKIYKGRNTEGSTFTGNINTGDARYGYYMQFGYFIHLLNSEKNLYSKKNGVLDIEIPLYAIKSNYGEGTCIASNNSMTINNDTCIIRNSNAKIVSPDGFFPKVEYENILRDNNPNIMNEYLVPGTNLGVIGNIYVNIGMLIDLYKSEHKNNNGQVFLGKYIKRILKEMEYGLGSINSFDIFVNDNKLVVIDKHYVETPGESRYAEKFQINILGTDTIVRNQKIVSKIFPSQATIIAIAAQSRENVASLQSSTYNYMNRGLKSRLFPIISENLEDIEKEADREQNILLNNIQNLLEYVNSKIVNFGSMYDFEKNKSTFNTLLNNFLVKVDKGTNYRAIIPVSLEISIDGIGGVIIGQIFTINKDIVPKEYAEKSVGFIVTGISHEISRPDWVTSYQTQFCLLNQDDRQKEISSATADLISKVNDKIRADREKLLNAVKVYNVTVGLFSDWYRHKFDIKPIDGTYNTSIISQISYRNDASAGVKNLKALLEQYKCVNFDGNSVTLERYLNDVEIGIYVYSKEVYENSYAKSKSKTIAFGEVRDLIKGFNKIGTDRIDVVLGKEYDSMFLAIVERVFPGILSHDSELDFIKDLFISNSNKALSDIKNNKKSQVIFNLLEDKSVTEFGTFKAVYMPENLIIRRPKNEDSKNTK